jgi:hypothetical protein
MKRDCTCIFKVSTSYVERSAHGGLYHDIPGSIKAI